MKRIPAYRVALVRESSVPYPSEAVTSFDAASRVIRDYIGNTDREHCVVLMLDVKHRIIGINTVSIGNLSGSLVHPREVFKPAILCNASCIILGHNHPSGDVTPSAEDKELTNKLKEAGEILGIKLLDHVIIGEASTCSFLGMGLL